jgi:hypothetical protein
LSLTIVLVKIEWRDTKLLAAEFLKTPSPNPARIPSQTLPCGRKISRGRANPNPRPNVSPCRVLFSSFNHLDSARNNFELCPVSTAKSRNSDSRQKCGRHKVPAVPKSPHQNLILQGFATRSVAPRSPIQNYE